MFLIYYIVNNTDADLEYDADVDGETKWDKFLNSERKRVRAKYGFPKNIIYNDELLDHLDKEISGNENIIIKDYPEDMKGKFAIGQAAVEYDDDSDKVNLYLNGGVDSIRAESDPREFQLKLGTLLHEYTHIEQLLRDKGIEDVLICEYEAFLVQGIEGDMQTFISMVARALTTEELIKIGLNLSTKTTNINSNSNSPEEVLENLAHN